MDCYRCSSSHGDQYGVLQQCLKDILSVIKPSPNDEGMRVRALRELETVVRSTESLKNVVDVRPYGSYISHLYTKWGDLDASVELTHHSSSSIDRQRKIEVLQDIKSELKRKGVGRNFNFIPTARVPVLRYESERQNVSCDVSIDNQLGWMKSRVLFLISKIDEQFRDLVLLIKEWARAHHINDPKSGTLNSYSLCLLVIFHFQTCEPAILPPLKDIYGRDFDDLTGNYWRTLERKIVDGCADNIAKFKSSRQRKGNNLAQLLITFFGKFSELERLSSDFAICTYTGRLERIRSNLGWMEKSHNLLIEDPFDHPDNASRAVGSQELLMISEAFKKTSRKLSKSSILSSRKALLANLVSPNIRSQLEDGGSQRGNCRTASVEFIGHITHKAGSQRGNCETAPFEFIGHITHKA